MDALNLPSTLFPEVHEATQALGTLNAGVAKTLGLPACIPVFGPVGDSQAAFLGSMAGERAGAAPAGGAFVNIGTGAQVAARSDRFLYAPPLETRPLPGKGYLLVGAQPSGGAAYAALERFFQMVLVQFAGAAGAPPVGALYDRMNVLAASVPSGADGLLCRPLFWGTRAAPEVRASWIGLSSLNFTPAHLTRALLEGMVELLREDLDRIVQATGTPLRCGVGCGNGLRKNPLLRAILAEKLGFPIAVPLCAEEAAVGAATLAAVGTAKGSRS
ncbi:MAG: FGGY-family carbohydrate kinase [Planctomycetota bacterium]|nr:FGGY-family carbohydrate kinase [Planctomycetota bacterium]